MPAAPDANAGISRPARQRGAPAVGPAATACPVGVWCGAPTLRPRPGRKSSGQYRADQEEERGGGGGRSNAGEGREGQQGRAKRDQRRKTKNKVKKQTPRDERTSHPYCCDREPVRARGGKTTTLRVTQQIGQRRAEMRPGTSRPQKTYVSGRSTETGTMGTWAHIWTA